MEKVKCILGTVVLLTLSVWTEAGVLRNSMDPYEMSVSERLELANKDLGGDILTGGGDGGAFRRVRRNADPCVVEDCKWPRSSDGKVYVPYVIDNNFSWTNKVYIDYVMRTFSQSTCINFTPRSNEPDFLHIQSLKGCRSFIGRQGGAQSVDLHEADCMEHGVIQHELLHALGFHHEQSRSDRDRHIRVLWDNVAENTKSNFVKINTLNQGTPYDYNSVMHYGRLSWSKNRLPTMESVPDPVPFGTATDMSPTDIERVNRLYCSFFSDGSGSGSGLNGELDYFTDNFNDDFYL